MTEPTRDADGVEYQHLTPEESWAIVEKAAQREYGISADEFVRRWQAGDYAGQHGRVMRVAMLLPEHLLNGTHNGSGAPESRVAGRGVEG